VQALSIIPVGDFNIILSQFSNLKELKIESRLYPTQITALTKQIIFPASLKFLKLRLQQDASCDVFLKRV